VGNYTALFEGPFQYIVVRVTSYFRHLASAPVHWQRQEPELQAVVRRSYKHIPGGSIGI
jgi:hypothetical protein